MPSTIEFRTETPLRVIVDGREMATELLAINPDDVYYGWSICPDIVSCLLSSNPDVVAAVETLLKTDRIIDLRIAAHLNAIATDTVVGSDNFFSVSDSMWLASRFPRALLAQHTRGHVALMHSGFVGVPIDKEDMRRTVTALCDTAHMLNRCIDAESNADIWHRVHGVLQIDKCGLAVMDKEAAREECTKSIYAHCSLNYERATISQLHGRHPDCRFVDHVARYLRIQKDVRRMSKMADEGGISPEECGVDGLLLSRIRKPNFEEAAVRKCVRSSNEMVSLDFSPLMLPLVQQFSRERGRPIFDAATSLEHIGQVASGIGTSKAVTVKNAEKFRKIGYHLLLGLAAAQSVATTAINIWGLNAYRRNAQLLEAYMRRVACLTTGGILHDPWSKTAQDCMDTAFGKGWEGRIPDPSHGSKLDAVAMVLQLGNDPLKPYPASVVNAVWEMAHNAVTTPELITMVVKRAHGGVLKNWLFSADGQMPSGERLINVTRAQAGLFSTVACIHAVIREFIWICKSDAEYPCIVHPPSGNLVLVSPINASQPLDVDHLLQNAVKAMSNRNVTPTTPHGRKGRRWA